MIAKIINRSGGKWAFAKLANILAESLWVDIDEDFGDFNYLLCLESEAINHVKSYIPIPSIKIAADKREIAQKFHTYRVPHPKTFIVNRVQEIEGIFAEYPQIQWILKYPIGCGGINHRLIENISKIPKNWPQPFLIQELIELSIPEVYRFYCIDGELFGFNARRLPDKNIKSPWVAHAQGARYEYGENPDREAKDVGKLALIATGLYDSFGVVDLVKNQEGKWYALEVGTDGIYNYVDREVENEQLFDEMNERLAIAFWKNIGTPPWGKNWRYRNLLN